MGGPAGNRDAMQHDGDALDDVDDEAAQRGLIAQSDASSSGDDDNDDDAYERRTTDAAAMGYQPIDGDDD